VSRYILNTFRYLGKPRKGRGFAGSSQGSFSLAAAAARGVHWGVFEKAIRRRDFLCSVAAAGASLPARTPLVVPIRRIMDRRATCTADEYHRFWGNVWPECFRTFAQCGIQLQTSDATGEIKLSPAGRPNFEGTERGVINLILTDRLPADWDNARSLAGATTVHEGYHLSVIALKYAHGNRIPYLSLNTCVHELLHALLQDVFVSNPKWYQSGSREFRDDCYCTEMWLFHEGTAVRRSAQAYLARLRTAKPGDVPAK
jgi:hypothetical protein